MSVSGPHPVCRNRTQDDPPFLTPAGCAVFFQLRLHGEPLPPARHVPQRVADLSAFQQGARIVVQFTLPSHTTENLDITKPMRVELRVVPRPTLYKPSLGGIAKLFETFLLIAWR